MGADNRNRDRRQVSQQFLGDIGFDVPQWEQNLLAEMKAPSATLRLPPAEAVCPSAVEVPPAAEEL